MKIAELVIENRLIFFYKIVGKTTAFKKRFISSVNTKILTPFFYGTRVLTLRGSYIAIQNFLKIKRNHTYRNLKKIIWCSPVM